jgi:hypothetical protein
MRNNRDLEGVHWPSSDERPDPAEHLVWSVHELMTFLTERCGLGGRRPSFVAENYGGLLPLWRSAIEAELCDALATCAMSRVALSGQVAS